ncbi:helix-turn-helix domain-containing protein [Pseudoroseicyclus aestuarii]|uniref:Cytoskeletal protein RodZ n=1 Tax=Pseudoroseicyclus aestuarii TaxID=1795041 RepID=A0A318SV43_9RHOB|nr:helix-turn-helix domain-containing protein [Pseudoroseicyclus aestuarii]PYE85781.1 cytoskeletal protein RodZ [Pseudoroseicyclus aestuarii]
MIGRGFRHGNDAEEVSADARGFDDFELKLGDMMRGERATMGKSLLDVQRELKIKAAYIAAIENSDPTAFDTPGFIAGYVRSYARYLDMDPDEAFRVFCRESGFVTAHGMSAAASAVRPSRDAQVSYSAMGRDIFTDSATPFIPAGERLLSGIEPRAVGSILVLAALIGGLGYGGWTLLQEVQKVTLAPVDQPPTVVADVDPLAGNAQRGEGALQMAEAQPASPELLDRLYRPEALDVPVMVARDGPISTLSPRLVAQAPQEPVVEPPMPGPMVAGMDQLPRNPPLLPAVAQGQEGVDAVLAGVIGNPALTPQAGSVQVTADGRPGLSLVAVRDAWVRVRSSDGTTLYEATMHKGDTWQVPALEQAPTIRVGDSGALYFQVAGTHYGPIGDRGAVTSDLALSVDNLTASYQVADMSQDSDLQQIVNIAQADLTE